MSPRYALYFAPARESALWSTAEAWLAQPEMASLTVSARRYGFHATIKAPMALGGSLGELQAAVARFAAETVAVELTDLAPRLIGGFLALTTEPQPVALTDVAARAVKAFEPNRAPLSADEQARRLTAQLTPRQIELVGQYGYPYVLEQFLFHMTLTDRLDSSAQQSMMLAATEWFAPALAEPALLDRLVIFEEAEPGAGFVRLDPDYLLMGA
ncbi:MAG: DUF1045 domain-containing protein [Devosia sp.]